LAICLIFTHLEEMFKAEVEAEEESGEEEGGGGAERVEAEQEVEEGGCAVCHLLRHQVDFFCFQE
jgi:hypothetical protein